MTNEIITHWTDKCT